MWRMGGPLLLPATSALASCLSLEPHCMRSRCDSKFEGQRHASSPMPGGSAAPPPSQLVQAATCLSMPSCCLGSLRAGCAFLFLRPHRQDQSCSVCLCGPLLQLFSRSSLPLYSSSARCMFASPEPPFNNWPLPTSPRLFALALLPPSHPNLPLWAQAEQLHAKIILQI